MISRSARGDTPSLKQIAKLNVAESSVSSTAKIFVIWKTSRGVWNSPTRGVGDSPNRRLGVRESALECWKENSARLRVGDSSTWQVGESPTPRLVFRLWISPRIRSQNRNGSKCRVRDLGTISKWSEAKASILFFFQYQSEAITFDSTKIYFKAKRTCLYSKWSEVN